MKMDATENRAGAMHKSGRSNGKDNLKTAKKKISLKVFRAITGFSPHFDTLRIPVQRWTTSARCPSCCKKLS